MFVLSPRTRSKIGLGFTVSKLWSNFFDENALVRLNVCFFVNATVLYEMMNVREYVLFQDERSAVKRAQKNTKTVAVLPNLEFDNSKLFAYDESLEEKKALEQAQAEQEAAAAAADTREDLIEIKTDIRKDLIPEAFSR